MLNKIKNYYEKPITRGDVAKRRLKRITALGLGIGLITVFGKINEHETEKEKVKREEDEINEFRKELKELLNEN
jgi:hypothetical protein